MSPRPLLLAACCAFALLTGCSPVAPGAACTTNTDCPGNQACTNGSCVAVEPIVECTAGQSRPCGSGPTTGACVHGTQQCVNGKYETNCRDEVLPTTETCNGVDDDCDGQTDEEVGTTWYLDADGDGVGSASASAQTATACTRPQGYAATNTDCNDTPGVGLNISPNAPEVCDANNVDDNCNGVANEGCGCSPVGSAQACCSGRGTQVCQSGAGGATLSMCSVSPTTEVCNGVDDDCDGQVDEAGPGLCPGAGQLCTGGQCACGQGQTQCGGSCVTLGGACTAGTGVCARTGVTACTSGAPACTATPGTPGVETCNGVDDDCDGQVDEAGPGLCAMPGAACSAGTCACPAGQQVCNGSCRAPTTEVCDGVDNNCDGRIDEGLTIACLPDGDNDGFTASLTTTQQCPVTGRPQAGNCPVGSLASNLYAGLDCNDANAAVHQVVASRADADGDLFCAGGTTNDCVGATALPGRRFASACAGEDCDDTNAAYFSLAAVRADADGDMYCAGALLTRCMGSAGLPGLRIVQECRNTDDCNDATSSQWQLAQVRVDTDGDGYCSGAAMSACIGTTPAAGMRLASSCLGDDCREGNALATTSCLLIGAYQTGSHGKTCVAVPATETFTVSSTAICPLGFTLSLPTIRAVRTSGTGTCSAPTQTSLTMTCNFLDGAICHVEGDCVAL